MPYFRFFSKCRANWVRQGTRRLKLALKSLKCLFYCSYFCSSYFFIIIILIITPRIFYTFYVALENSKTFPQEIEFSKKNPSSGNLTFSESFHCRLLFSGKAKNSPKKFERFKPLLGRPNRSNFFSDANYWFILLLKHSRMHNEPFQIISQKTVVGCPCFFRNQKKLI